MEQLLQDFRFGARMLARRPGFTLAVVLTLAIGIGANSAIFSIINGLFMKPLMYPESGQLVVIHNSYPKAGIPRSSLSIPDYLDRANLDSLESAALYHWTSAAISPGERPEQLPGIRATPSLFATLKVQPFLGRGFSAHEAVPGNDSVIVISNDLWQRMFDGRADVIGEQMRVDGEAHEIVGIMPAGVAFPNDDASFFLPFAFTPEQMSDEGRGNEFASMIARLAPGATIAALERDMEQVTRNVAERLPEGLASLESTGFRGIAQDFREEKMEEARAPLLLLQLTVSFLLLIACANVANLMLARVIARQKEMSVRAALGAGRLRLARQLLSESLLLALVGGAGGVLVAHASVEALLSSGALGNGVFDIGVDGTVLGFALVVTLGTGLFFGLFPVVSVWRSNTVATLKDGRGTAGSRGARVSRNALVVVQVTMAVVLLVVSGLLIRSFVKLESVSPGFIEEGVLTAHLSLPQSRYADEDAAASFQHRLEERVAAIPGVAAFGVSSTLPFGNSSSVLTYRVIGREIPDGSASPHANLRIADGGYFDTLKIPLLRGRVFDSRDARGSERVAVIDEVLARKFFADVDPIGRQVLFGEEDVPENRATIVGVVGAIKHRSLKESFDRETIYRAISQEPRNDLMFAVRTEGDAAAFIEPLRNAVLSLDAELPVYDVQTMTARIDRSLRGQRMPAFLLAAFSGIALLLAAIGLYGVLAFSVAQRTSELGVRMALGAARGDLMKLVLGQGGRLIGAGLLFGLAGAYALARLLGSQLYDVTSTDPLVFLSVLAFLGLTGFVACVVPAKRATRVDPMAALRYE